MASTPKHHLILATISEKVGRYDDAMKHMKTYVELGHPLSAQERILFQSIYKSKLSDYRRPWRDLANIQEKIDEPPKKELLGKLIAKVERDFKAVCNDAIVSLTPFTDV